MRFGQHQSFYLRVNWLSKAIRMITEDEQGNRFFYDEFGFERIGLGRNMVKSLKFWALATNILSESRDADQKAIHEITTFGELVYQYDRFVRLPLTTSLLHFFLASNKDQASFWYWFFNEFPHRSATYEELIEILQTWVQQHSKKPVSENTLKRDLECLRQLYMGNDEYQAIDPEDILASPLSKLRLLHTSKDLIAKRSPLIENIGVDAFYFVLLIYCESHKVQSLTLEEIQYKPLLWGKIFNLTSNQILDVLEKLHSSPLYPVTFIKTNQIFSLNIEVEAPYSFLEKAYRRKVAL
ncbi:DUF4007 family protein [Paenibacillus sp. OAS669]|uniref:DUF4007 family protein n=1 Tax=Paenibacillus sp. OAS669 TaxID=2663821 RepID=UPI00178A3FCF|nr:DUF4007 family protein [Paenibacillus sp. OAS669]MBE1444853.1 hypothetical protein [Paenibacillus sp. OAS669]